MLLARKCKITVADFGLIPLKSGELAYITSRMDRQKKQMLHMEDFCQILNKMTAQKYNGSMEQIGKALREYSTVPGLDVIRYFELALFCFLTGNSDMHLKNFSLLQQQNGEWELSPAYDLVPVKVILPQDTEELALTLNGKKNRLKRSDFETFGMSLKLNEVQIRKAVQRITDSLEKFLPETLQESFLPEEMQLAVNTLITERIARIKS
jgi:serine/threonine-protein kinase HipA